MDHAISLRAGQWLEAQKHPDYYLDAEEGCFCDDEIYIVTRDRFGLALVDILRQHLDQSSHKAVPVHSTTIDQCFERLLQRSQDLMIKWNLERDQV